MKSNIWNIIAIFFFLFVIFFSVFIIVTVRHDENKAPSMETSNSTSNTLPSDVVEPTESTEPTEPSSTTAKEPVILEATSKQYAVVESDSIRELEIELAYCQEKLHLSQSIIDSAMELGYEDTCDFIQVIYQDCENYQSYIFHYEERIKELKEIQYAEYPAAAYIWYYMKAQGWSDYVCAGIMGNIMQETGGTTLNINYKHEDKYYYGMCCWRKEYHPEVVGLDLEGQCEYLVRSAESIINTYGYLYKDGYDFEQFLAATSIEEVANAFMVVYERPGYTESPKRIANGERAYAYFVD